MVSWNRGRCHSSTPSRFKAVKRHHWRRDRHLPIKLVFIRNADGTAFLGHGGSTQSFGLRYCCTWVTFHQVTTSMETNVLGPGILIKVLIAVGRECAGDAKDESKPSRTTPENRGVGDISGFNVRVLRHIEI